MSIDGHRSKPLLGDARRTWQTRLMGGERHRVSGVARRRQDGAVLPQRARPDRVRAAGGRNGARPVVPRPRQLRDGEVRARGGAREAAAVRRPRRAGWSGRADLRRQPARRRRLGARHRPARLGARRARRKDRRDAARRDEPRGCLHGLPGLRGLSEGGFRRPGAHGRPERLSATCGSWRRTPRGTSRSSASAVSCRSRALRLLAGDLPASVVAALGRPSPPSFGCRRWWPRGSEGANSGLSSSISACRSPPTTACRDRMASWHARSRPHSSWSARAYGSRWLHNSRNHSA